jgi:hypothetical protein
VRREWLKDWGSGQAGRQAMNEGPNSVLVRCVQNTAFFKIKIDFYFINTGI